MEKQELILALNELIRYCKDSEKGLKLAANEVHTKEYKTIMLNAAKQRADFVKLVQEEVRELGGTPRQDGSVSGTLHRGWMNLRYQLNLHSDAIVMQECLRGEDAALDEYKKLIEEKSLQLDPVLEGLFVSFIEMRDQLRNIVMGKKEPAEKAVDSSLLHL